MTNSYVEKRYEQVKELKTKGVEVYPKFSTTQTLRGFLEKYNHLENEQQCQNLEYLAGRIIRKRKLAKETIMYTLYAVGSTIRASSKIEDNLTTTMPTVGDLCGVAGYPFKDKNGNISIHIKSLNILSPCLHNDLPAMPEHLTKFTLGSPRLASKHLKPVSQVHQVSPGVCSYPRSPAYGLGIASAIALLLAHSIINDSMLSSIVPVVVSVAQGIHILQLLSGLLPSFASFYLAASVLSLESVTFSILYFFITVHAKVVSSSFGDPALPNEGGVHMVQAQVPPTSHDPVFVQEGDKLPQLLTPK